MRKSLVFFILGMMILQTSQDLPIKCDDFTSFESQYATIYYQNGVSIEYAKEIALGYDNSYEVLTRLFNIIPSKKFKIYIFQSQEELVKGLISIGGMSKSNAEFFNQEGIAPMPIDYVFYIPPSWKEYDSYRAIAHEFTHYFIVESSCPECRYNFKWLDEGLAEVGGYKSASSITKGGSRNWRKSRYEIVRSAVKKNRQFLLTDITKEPEWSNRIRNDQEAYFLEYAEGYVAVEYLEYTYGFDTILKILNLIRNGKEFKTAFRDIIGITLDEYQGKFSDHLKNGIPDYDNDDLMNFEEEKMGTSPKKSDSDGDGILDGFESEIYGTNPLKSDSDGDDLNDGKEIGMIIDGKLDDWKTFGIEPIIRDPKGDNTEGDSRTDIIEVYAAIDKNYLYVAFLTLEKPDLNAGYIFAIDVNNDGDWDYSVGFQASYIWFYDVRNYPNRRWPEESKNLDEGVKYFDSVAEIRLPLTYIGKFKNLIITPWVVKYDPIRGVENTSSGLVIFSEKIVSTDPLSPDTDGDGLKDGSDPHPLEKESAWQKRVSGEATNLYSQAQADFQNKAYQKAKELFSQAKLKYQELGDDTKVKETDDWIKKCNEELSKQQSSSPTSLPQEQKKTSIPVLTVICAILFVYIERKVTK